jgi:hypothetical protein
VATASTTATSCPCAPTAIEAGEIVGTFEGTPAEVDGDHVLWIETDDGRWEGIRGTGTLRWLNHSRSPNVEFDGAELRARRRIDAGEELLIDYGEEWSEVP